MKIAITGATGFLGRHILTLMVQEGHQCRCWKRPESNLTGIEESKGQVEWIDGNLGDIKSIKKLVQETDAVVHAALARQQGVGFRESGGRDLSTFLRLNLMGSISLIEAAKESGSERFVFISTCAVHEKILDDRPLDETHPLWPLSHYGAYKAAVEKFAHSFGMNDGWKISSLRPTGIYGIAHPPEKSKWAELVRRVKDGGKLMLENGGKEVHAKDVARAVSILLKAEGVAGQSYNCYDRYISEGDVVRIASEALNADCEIIDTNKGPKNQIDTKKIRSIGMEFGGEKLLQNTVRRLARLVSGIR